MKNIAIFISGRGSNMEAILKECQTGILKGIANPVFVFSNNPEAKGLEIAQAMGIKTECIDSKGLRRKEFDLKVLELLQNYPIDLIVLAGYMRIISPVLVDAYSKKIVNIHPADTTKHQGLDGYEWAFDEKLIATKITVHYVDEGLDTGSIIAQENVNLQGIKSLEELEKKGLAVEHQFYSRVLAQLLSDKNQ